MRWSGLISQLQVSENNDPDNREERNRKDKFPPLRYLFEEWIHQCRVVVVVRHLCRIDAGTGSNNPYKPAKYGILIKCLSEVTFPFTYISVVFSSKPELVEGMCEGKCMFII